MTTINFDEEMEELINEHKYVQRKISRGKELKAAYIQEVQEAEQYLGELKHQIIELMNDQGVLSTEVKNMKIFRKTTPQKLIVKDINEIPTDYLKVTYEPNKTKIKNALKDGLIIKGVDLDNGGETLVIKHK